MRLEEINNKEVMNIGLININYNENIQLEKIRPLVDELIYFDNDDLSDILRYTRDKDTLYILTYSFINDNTLKALNFKSKLDNRHIKINSIMERTVDNSSANNDLIFTMAISMYEVSKFIMQNRIC